jgi:hypothetical protein
LYSGREHQFQAPYQFVNLRDIEGTTTQQSYTSYLVSSGSFDNSATKLNITQQQPNQTQHIGTPALSHLPKSSYNSDSSPSYEETSCSTTQTPISYSTQTSFTSSNAYQASNQGPNSFQSFPSFQTPVRYSSNISDQTPSPSKTSQDPPYTCNQCHKSFNQEYKLTYDSHHSHICLLTLEIESIKSCTLVHTGATGHLASSQLPTQEISIVTSMVSILRRRSFHVVGA